MAIRTKLGNAEDNFHRASRSFRGLSDYAMAQEHGQSGKSRREWLTDYQREVDDFKEALKWLETK